MADYQGDREITQAIIIGLARTLIKITAMLVEAGALDRNHAIRSLKDFKQDETNETPVGQMTELWVEKVIEALESDPPRPPTPAEVIQLYPKDDD